MDDIGFGNYRLVHVYGRTTPELEREVIEFWTRNNAVPDPREAAQRARQVFYAARNAQNELVAVCTLFTTEYGQPPENYWFYRMFIRPEDRHSGLAFAMTSNTRKHLETHHRPGIDPPGLMIVTQNEILMNDVVRKQFRQAGWEHLGQAPDGADIWLKRFVKPS